MCFHGPEDRKYAADLRRAAPGMHAAYAALGEAVFGTDDAALPKRTRELIAIAVAVTTQCPFCIDSHSRAAANAGATDAEIAEAVMVATAIRAGGGVTHGFQVMRTVREERAGTTG